MIRKENIANLYRLSPLQGGMLFHSLYDNERSEYFEQAEYMIEGAIDTDAFVQAWQILVERHDALRTAIVHSGVAEPIQIVLRSRPVPFDVRDLTGLDPAVQQHEIDEYRSDIRNRRFELSSDPLLALALFRIAPASCIFVMSFHHIIMDGWCQGILASELSIIYRSILRGNTAPLPPAPQYREFIRWLEARKKDGREEESLAFWRDYLGDLRRLTPFPRRDRPDREEDASGSYESVDVRLGPIVTAGLEDRMRQEGVTISAVLRSLVGVFLARFHGTDEGIFLATVSGRPSELPRAASIVGLFINAVPVRVPIDPLTTLSSLFADRRADAGRIEPHQSASLPVILGNLGETSTDLNLLLVVENYPYDSGESDLPFQLRQIDVSERTNYDLTVQVHPGQDLGLTFAFPTDRVDAALVGKTIEWFRTALEQIANGAESVSELMTDESTGWISPENRPGPTGFNRIGDIIERIKVPTRADVSLRLVSTFTVDPIVPQVEWWLGQMGCEANISVGRYGQVFQELLDRQGPLYADDTLGILFVRWEDWLRDLPSDEMEKLVSHLESSFDAFLDVLDGSNPPGGLLLLLLPTDRAGMSPNVVDVLDACDRDLLSFAKERAHMKVVDLRTSPADWYVDQPFDAVADRAGHVPYSTGMNRVIGSELARAVLSRYRNPMKVIALDCDNTLWRGICGEDGARGVTVDAPHQALQRFVRAKNREGFLIVLCSKNNDEDVREVFNLNDGMLLEEEHIAERRVNWRPKSQNLRELADSLNVGLDSFMFLDDSPVEISEVRGNAPEVLSIQVPSDPDGMNHLLRHLWATDRWSLTDEDRRRSSMYAAERARRASESVATSLDSFLEGLAIEVEMAPLNDRQVPRAAQLTQRTNQFNVSTRRRSEAEIRQLIADPTCRVWAISVTDRFGSYGFSGLMIAFTSEETVTIDTLLLSCRVLGRGVEDGLMTGLRQWGESSGISRVVIPFRRTAKNAPALEFLRGWDREGELPDAEGCEVVFRRRLCDIPMESEVVNLSLRDEPIPSDELAELQEHVPESREKVSGSVMGVSSRNVVTEFNRAPDFRLEEVVELRHASEYLPLFFSTEQRLEELHARTVETRRGNVPRVTFVEPIDEDETALCRLFTEILRVDRVGMLDDFFALGGNSLTAIELLSKFEREFGGGMTLHDIFEYRTPRGLLPLVKKSVDSYRPIPSTPRQDHYPLSFAQQRLWVLEDLGLTGSSYVMGGAMEVRGRLDVRYLEGAVNAVITRHESLRTAFPEINGAPVQKVLDKLEIRVPEFDMRRLTLEPGQASRLIDRLIQDEMTERFDLASPPLLRAGFIHTDDDRGILTLFLHHIIADGWSFPILVDEIAQAYQHLKTGREGKIFGDEPGIQYRDYAVWQREELAGGAFDADIEFWKENLSGTLPRLELPLDRPRAEREEGTGDVCHLRLSGELRRALEALALKEETTLFTLLIASVRLSLWRITGQREIILGVPVAGREHPDLEDQIGFYVNTIPIRGSIDPTRPSIDAVHRSRDETIEAFSHARVPFDQILSLVDNDAREMARNPLFDAMVVLQNNREGSVEIDGLEFVPYGEEAGAGKFDLTFNFRTSGDELDCALEYRDDVFDRSRIEEWGEILHESLRQMLADSDESVAELNGCRPVPHDWSSGEESLIEMIDSVGKAFPDAVAIERGVRTITYETLMTASRRAADTLRGLGITAQSRVVVTHESGPELVTLMLALFRLNALYIPVDPEHPKGRILDVVRRSAADLVVGGSKLDFTGAVVPFVSIESVLSETYGPARARDAVLISTDENTCGRAPLPSDALYAIYTSGSTGQPKGVVVQDAAFTNMIRCQVRTFGIRHSDRVLQFASPSFDASLSETFMALLAGATLVFPSMEVRRDAIELTEFIVASGVSVATIPPILIRSLGDFARGAFRVLISAGEAAPVERLLGLARDGNVAVFNAYGPTEAAVCSTIHMVDPTHEYDDGIPIGRPIEGTSAFVADDELFPLPPGIPGELVLTGAGLADGYLDEPELNAGSFLNPAWAPGLRCYRTGDIAVLAADGEFGYVGRRDSQVKIRGHRVEPEEVRQAILSVADVTDVAVVAREERIGAEVTTDLCAFVVVDYSVVLSDLQSRLREHLPSFFIPADIRGIASLPMTVNGKVDFDSLARLASEPRDEFASSSEADATAAGREVATDVRDEPVDDRLRLLMELTGRLLGRRVETPDVNFFAIGGDSLRLIRLRSLLAGRGIEVDMREFYSRETLREVSRTMSTHDGAKEDDDDDIERRIGPVPATPIQRWVASQLSREEFEAFTLPLIAEFEGDIDIECLIRVVRSVINRHDALRMRAALPVDGELTVRIAPPDPDFHVPTYVLDRFDGDKPGETSAELAALIDRTVGRFSLDGESTLVRPVIVAGEGRGLLIFGMHHLLNDAVSVDMILRDLNHGWRESSSGIASESPRLAGSYRAWAEETSSEIGMLGSGRRDAWRKVSDAVEVLRPHFLREEGAYATGGTHRFHRELGRDVTSRILGLTERGITPAHLLLVALHRAIGICLDSTVTIPVLVEGHGRATPGIETGRTIGWLTTLTPILVESEPSTSAMITSVTDELARVRSHQREYLGLLVEESGGGDRPWAVPPITFNYLGEFTIVDGSKGEVGALLNYSGFSGTGTGNRLNELEINSLVVDGELKISIEMSAMIRAEIVDRLDAALASSIDAVIDQLDQAVQPYARVIALPSAIALPGAYLPIATYLTDGIELLAPDAAGNGSRIHLPPSATIGEIARDLIRQIDSRLDLPWVLFGHSMGALVIREFLDAISEEGYRLPEAIIVSGCAAPSTFTDGRRKNGVPDRETLRELFRTWAPDQSVDSAQIEKAVDGALVNYQAVAAYRAPTTVSRYSIPLTIVFATGDNISLADILAWSDEFGGEARVMEIDGGHLYLRSHADRVAARIVEILDRDVSPQRGDRGGDESAGEVSSKGSNTKRHGTKGALPSVGVRR